MNNLITFCNSCHDFVELNGFDFNLETNQIKVVANNDDWHKWVYGSYKKPEGGS